MKKNFKYYLAFWAALFAVFNVISWFSTGWKGYEKYTPGFWVGYVFITVMFIGQLACSFLAFRSNDAKKIFYNISLVYASYAGLIASFVVGGLCMLLPLLPYWAGVIVCAIVLVFNVLSLIKAKAAAEEVIRIDEKVKVKTFFIKSLTADAESLMASAKSEKDRAECRKVYEAARYSDPMSHDALAALEGQILAKFAELSAAVSASDSAQVAEKAKEVIVLLENRNGKCKLLK